MSENIWEFKYLCLAPMHMTTYYVLNDNMYLQTLGSAVSWRLVFLSSLTPAPLTVYVWQQHVCAAARRGRDGVWGGEGDRSGELDHKTRHTFHFLSLSCYWCLYSESLNDTEKDIFRGKHGQLLVSNMVFWWWNVDMGHCPVVLDIKGILQLKFLVIHRPFTSATADLFQEKHF